jgi:hypothetical protein
VCGGNRTSNSTRPQVVVDRLDRRLQAFSSSQFPRQSRENYFSEALAIYWQPTTRPETMTNPPRFPTQSRRVSRENMWDYPSEESIYDLDDDLEEARPPPVRREVRREVRRSNSTRNSKGNRKRRDSPSIAAGTVSLTLLGPAAAMIGGNKKWKDMKTYIRSLSEQRQSTLLAHRTELV